MPIVGIDHIQIAIPSGGEDTARAFYCALLGFTEVSKPETLAGRGGLWLSAGDAVVHLGAEDGFEPPAKAHPGFLVTGLPGFIATLQAAGASLNHDVPLPGYDRVHVRDPFGNRLELLERVET